MLDRLAQLIVDRLRPQIEQVIREHFDELRLEVRDDIDEYFNGAVNTFNITLSKSLPRFKQELEKEVAQKIVRGLGQ